jgi:hypothetical protein
MKTPKFDFLAFVAVRKDALGIEYVDLNTLSQEPDAPMQHAIEDYGNAHKVTRIIQVRIEEIKK